MVRASARACPFGQIIVPRSWPVPALFEFLADRGRVGAEEMFRVFNMGIGMILFVAPAGLVAAAKLLEKQEALFYTIGTAHAGNREVTIDSRPTCATRLTQRRSRCAKPPYGSLHRSSSCDSGSKRSPAASSNATARASSTRRSRPIPSPCSSGPKARRRSRTGRRWPSQAGPCRF